MNIIDYCNGEEFDQRVMDEYIEKRNKYFDRKRKLKELRNWYELYKKYLGR